jgi:hypothetical protein
MGRRRGWSAAVFAAAALMFCCVCTVASAIAQEDDETRVILFSGRDLWRDGAFAYGGLLVAPGGFEDDGLLLKLLFSGGVYRYRAGDLDRQTVIGAEGAAQILPGWRIKRHGVEMKFFFGPDFERHKLWPDDPGNRLRGGDIGLRMNFEFWTEPTANTVVNGDLSLSSIATSWSGRIAYGWRVFQDLFEDGFYLGPELQYFNSDGYRHTRVGLHITELKAGTYEWSAAAGWARDSDGRSGPYLRLDVLQRL